MTNKPFRKIFNNVSPLNSRSDRRKTPWNLETNVVSLFSARETEEVFDIQLNALYDLIASETRFLKHSNFGETALVIRCKLYKDDSNEIMVNCINHGPIPEIIPSDSLFSSNDLYNCLAQIEHDSYFFLYALKDGCFYIWDALDDFLNPFN